MIPALVKELGNTFNKTSGTTLALTTTGTVAAGNLIVARILFDNGSVTLKPVVSSITKMAGETANWLFLGAARSPGTTTGAASSGEMWAIQTTVEWSVAAYTVTLDSAVTQKAITFTEYSGVQAVLRSTVGGVYSTNTTAASASTTGTAPQVNDLAIGFIFGSNAAAVQAGSTNTTGGSWSAPAGFGSTGGNVATNNFGLGQYKVLTAGSHQTYANSAAMTAGNGSVVAILQSMPGLNPVSKSDAMGVTDSVATQLTTLTPKMETLTDDFSTDLAKWPGTYGTVVLDAGRAKITSSDGYPALWTDPDLYDMVDSSAFVEMVTPYDAGGGGRETVFEIRLPDNDNKIYFYLNGTGIEASSKVATVITNHRGATYDPVAMRWLKIAHTSPSTVTWSTSPDGLNWTVYTSASVGFTPSGCAVVITAGWYLPDSPWDIYVDNFNVPPPLPVGASDAVGLTDTFTTELTSLGPGPSLVRSGRGVSATTVDIDVTGGGTIFITRTQSATLASMVSNNPGVRMVLADAQRRTQVWSIAPGTTGTVQISSSAAALWGYVVVDWVVVNAAALYTAASTTSAMATVNLPISRDSAVCTFWATNAAADWAAAPSGHTSLETITTQNPEPSWTLVRSDSLIPAGTFTTPVHYRGKEGTSIIEGVATAVVIDPLSIQKVSTFTDTFDTEINSDKWPTVNRAGTISWEAGQAAILEGVGDPPTSGFMSTDFMYDLKESSVYCKFTPPSPMSSNSFSGLVVHDLGEANGIWALAGPTPAEWEIRIVNNKAKNTNWPARNPAKPYVRLRLAGGTAYVEESADTQSWTAVRTFATTMNPGLVCVKFLAHHWGGSDPKYTAYFDDVNTPPGAGQALTHSASDALGISDEVQSDLAKALTHSASDTVGLTDTVQTVLTHPKTETISDTFDTQIDPAKWTATNTGGATTVWDAGRVAQTTGSPGVAGYSTLFANGWWDATESYLSAQIVVPAVARVTREMKMYLRGDGAANNAMIYVYNSGGVWRMRFRNREGGVNNDSTALTLPHDPVAHAWWRIRILSGTIYYDTAPDGLDWTNRWSRTPATVDPFKRCQIIVDVGQYAAEVDSGTGYTDNINVVPAGQALTHSASDSVGVTDSVEVQLVPAGLPKIETLTDTFDTQIDPAKWTVEGGTAWGAGKVVLTPDLNPGYARIHSLDRYDLINSEFYAKATPPGVMPTREFILWFVADDSNKAAFIMYDAGGFWGIRFVVREAGTDNSSSGLGYQAVDHAWWRLRLLAGSFYFDTAPDGVAWANQWYFTPASVAMFSSCSVYLECGQWSSQVDIGTGHLDNVNALDTGQTLTHSASDTVGLTDTPSTSAAYDRSLPDTVGLTDIATYSLARALSWSDAVGLTDLLTEAEAKAATAADSVGVTDRIEKSVSKALPDTAGVTDTWVKALALDRSEAVGLTDLFIGTEGEAATAIDAVGITDIAAYRSVKPTVTDLVGSGQSLEPFTTYPIEEWAEGTVHGAYRSVFNSNGPHGVIDGGAGNRVIRQQPEFVEGEGLGGTRASLSVSTASYKDVDVTMRMRTVSQNRPTAPNTWERAWAVCAYVDNDWFYYVVLKTNGIEVGKRDPAYPGGQRFLPWYQATNWPVGVWNKVRIKLTEVFTGTQIQIWVDDVLQTSYWNDTQNDYFIDEERPLNLGAIGFYNEDAEVHFDDVALVVPGLVDTASMGIHKMLSDTAGVTDQFSGLGEGAAGFFDVVGITDEVTRVGVYVRSYTDTEGLTDSALPARGLPATFGDTESVTDTVQVVLSKALVDTAGLVDTFAVAATRSFPDTVGLTDTWSIVLARSLDLSDRAGVTDTWLSPLGLARTYSEAEGVSDTSGSFGVFARDYSDPVDLSDITSISKSAPGLFSEPVVLTDYIILAGVYQRGYQDSVNLTDVPSTAYGFARTYADTEGLSDYIAKQMARTYSDTENVPDVLSRGVGRMLVDVQGLTDSMVLDLVVPVQARPKIWSGTAFEAKPGKVWNGTDWTEKPWKTWNGSAWVPEAAPPPFTPASITGLASWLDAKDYTPGAWPNKGGGPAITIVGSPVMAVSANLLNGLPVVRFKTSEGRLRSAWPYPVHDYTLLYLTRWVGPGTGRAWSVQYPPSNLLVGMHTSQPDTMYDNGTWVTPGTSWANWSPGPGPWRMYGADCAAGVQSRFFRDGVSIGTNAVIDGGGLTNGWGLSGYDATSTPETMDIEVAELVLYNRKLSDAERQQVEDYLRAKWGL